MTIITKVECAADHLLIIAQGILWRKEKLFLPGPGTINDPPSLARAELALKFAGGSKALVFKALVENWSLDQIARELHS